MLASPARYFPLDKGLYEVAPGLKPLGTPFGNGEADNQVFQIDSEFHKFRQNKLQCRAERLEKYYLTSDFHPEAASAVNQFLVKQFTTEHPGHFKLEGKEPASLYCSQTQETLQFDRKFELAGFQTKKLPPQPAYTSAFDALCSQVQEDVAVVCRRPDGSNWLAALHLSSPAHWSGEDKIGKDFFATHLPVPGIEKVNKAAAALVEAMVHKGPFVRFVWGFGTDSRLNHHPVAPPGISESQWKGRAFPERPFILRVERQVTWGLPEVNVALFIIRVSFIPGEEIIANEKMRSTLRSAFLSMSPESRVYKGVSGCFDQLMRWLDQKG